MADARAPRESAGRGHQLARGFCIFRIQLQRGGRNMLWASGTAQPSTLLPATLQPSTDSKCEKKSGEGTLKTDRTSKTRGYVSGDTEDQHLAIPYQGGCVLTALQERTVWHRMVARRLDGTGAAVALHRLLEVRVQRPAFPPSEAILHEGSKGTAVSPSLDRPAQNMQRVRPQNSPHQREKKKSQGVAGSAPLRPKIEKY